MFCPKCGSLLMPKKEGNKTIMCCSCGYKDTGKDSGRMTERGRSSESNVDVVDKEEENLPTTEAECPKCGCNEAFYWLVQTRASDEPETKFHKCVKCKHTWRDYS